MREERRATTDHPISETLARRESPYAFDARMVDVATLRSLFEAARWAASSYNEQPWRYVVATREDARTYDAILKCLVEANRAWAKTAPVLAVGVVGLAFARNGKPNVAAAHDLGAASAQLTFEATTRGLYVHQMVGFDPEAARAAFSIPEGFEAKTALAIGYRGDPSALSEALAAKDAAPRTRRPLREIVFGGRFGDPAFP
jgi:nitroreductase